MGAQIHSVPAVISADPCEVAVRAAGAGLRPYVLGYSGFRSCHGRPIAHLLLPLASTTLIVDFGSPSGLALGPRDSATARGETTWGHGVSVGLTPLGTAALLGVPMAELGGGAVALADLLGPAASELPGRLGAEPGWPQRFDLIERTLAAILSGRRRTAVPDRAVLTAWRRLQQPDRPTVGQLAAGMQVSRRALERGFRRHVGLSPATVARIARFQRVVDRLSAGAGPSQAAADSGYADHPHLARETRAMAGLTPTGLAAFLSTPPIMVAPGTPPIRVSPGAPPIRVGPGTRRSGSARAPRRSWSQTSKTGGSPRPSVLGMTLEGKTALVTGGSKGIGRAVVEQLATLGARVVFTYRQDKEAADDVVRACPGTTAVRADQESLDSLGAMFEPVRDGLDILVINVGTVTAAPISQLTPEEFDRVFTVNTKVPLFAIQRATPLLRHGGRIVTISTLNTLLPAAGLALYCSSKGALEQITAVASRELGPRGITVNTVSPGATDTATLRAANAPEALEQAARMTALGRLGQPGDVAAVVAFLVSDQGRWITGQNLRATGGLYV
ncbi:SDR family oxidoreductase [Actinoplanes sp. LDG1-06]|uniref:SDR family oxidoreductase n=1 Tax=Paractinoplanes ovalisporus TaxID=2810368 RepID=A0ABS2AL19_9ACTN|nr:SDR family oxidoreductase [Actinoplanes ovalisporus]MBM2619924.1 SDR family oxidoreductase [Actinoplanes ovalisporus]